MVVSSAALRMSSSIVAAWRGPYQPRQSWWSHRQWWLGMGWATNSKLWCDISQWFKPEARILFFGTWGPEFRAAECTWNHFLTNFRPAVLVSSPLHPSRLARNQTCAQSHPKCITRAPQGTKLRFRLFKYGLLQRKCLVVQVFIRNMHSCILPKQLHVFLSSNRKPVHTISNNLSV
jgi:hypothetical protein